MTNHAIAVSAFLVLALASGCATSRTSGWENEVSQSSVSPEQAAKTLSEAKAAWAKRDDRASLEKALQLLEQHAKETPGNYETLVLLCRGHYLLADAHLTNMDERKQHWEIGTTWGERALALNPEFKKKVKDEGKNPEEALDSLSRDFVDALYWTAVNLGKWGKNSGIATALKYRGRLMAFIQKVEALDPNFYHGAAARYWGTYYAVIPGFAGGDMNKSWDYFQKSLKQAPNYFGTHVLIAENYAPKKSDKELFKKELNFVIKGKPESLPDVAPEQRLEQKKAKDLLAKMDDLF